MATTTTRGRKPKAQQDTSAEQDKALTDVTDDKTGKPLTVQQLKNKLRNEAEREVLDKHKSEVVTITAAKYKAHNLEYVRRLSEEEKAQKLIEEMYERFPNLRPQTEQQQEQEEAPKLVQAVPGGALATFRAGDYEVQEVEAREGE